MLTCPKPLSIYILGVGMDQFVLILQKKRHNEIVVDITETAINNMRSSTIKRKINMAIFKFDIFNL